MVCSTHSSKRILLPNIHKTQPQRVCDVCSVLIEERNSLRLSDSFKSKLSESSKSEINNNTPVTNTTTATSGSSDVVIEEKQENSQNSFISTRRFSLKSLKDLKTSTQTTPEPCSPDNNSEEIMKRSKILSKLLSETVTDPSTSSTTASPTTSNTTSSTQTATKHKIIPAFSVPITFMLTHDSVKARKSILLTNDETSMTRDIELSSLPSDPPRSVSHEFSSIDERPSLIPSYRSPIQSSHSILSQSDTGLLNMLTTILKDDRELLMESDDDENADSSSDDDGEDDDEENEEVERSATRTTEERSLNYPNLE